MKIKILLLAMLIVQQSYCQFSMPGSLQPADFDTMPTLLWKFKTNGPIVGSPVIDKGIVFVGSLDSTLYALDLTNGKVKWKIPTGGPIRSSVCIAQQRLFLLSADGILYQMDKDSGSVNGFFQTMNGYMGDRQHDYADHFNSTPVILDSTIYFGSGEYIYALSINDGYLQWTCKTGNMVHTSPAISAGWLYAGSFDGNLYAVNLKTGNPGWKFKSTGNYFFPKGEIMGNPVVASGMVFAGARDNNLYAVDVKGGSCNWMKQFPFGWALPVTANDSIIYVGTSDDRELYALDIRTGREVWKVNAGFNIIGGVAIATRMGYFGTLAGKIFGVALRTGKIKWTIELDSYKSNRLAWLKDDNSFRDDINKLIKTPLDLLKMYSQLGAIFGTPAVESNKLVVAGYDGWIYCFSK
ncbi:MAG: PQQ-binding-like beta-propeller repeat protein [Bacteroidetes bacterium]|nr:PQQ-binding-like beta-propeller repeat protein [Bacteroidota bacterium]